MLQSNFLQSHEIFSQFTPTFIHCGIGPLHTGETQRREAGHLFIDFWSQKQTLQQKEWTVRQSFLHIICRKGQKTLHVVSKSEMKPLRSVAAQHLDPVCVLY